MRAVVRKVLQDDQGPWLVSNSFLTRATYMVLISRMSALVISVPMNQLLLSGVEKRAFGKVKSSSTSTILSQSSTPPGNDWGRDCQRKPGSWLGQVCMPGLDVLVEFVRLYTTNLWTGTYLLME